MKKYQKGQDIVEFALLLPVFLLIIVGIIYVGFFFGDYMTLSNIARSAAREAVVSTDVKTVSNGNGGTVQKRDFDKITQAYNKILKNEHIKTSLYLYKNRENPLSIESAKLPQSDSNEETAVKVEIPMTINKGQTFVNAVFNLGILSPDDTDYTITYYMHDENPVGK